MGPRLISRGVVPCSKFYVVLWVLQWGRGSLAAACANPYKTCLQDTCFNGAVAH